VIATKFQSGQRAREQQTFNPPGRAPE